MASTSLAVIVVAAGRSTRFGGPTKKTFRRLAGRALFLHSLERFAAYAGTRQIILALAAEDLDDVRAEFAAELERLGVGPLVAGGAERSDTVANALAHVDASAELVAVHDAARPLVSVATIAAVVEAAAETGAALAAEPAVSTVKRADRDGLIRTTLPRSEIWLAQTPQIFRRDLLLRAYAARDPSAPATDDCELVERLGAPVRPVASDGPNFKVTAPADLVLAEAWLAAGGHAPASSSAASSSTSSSASS
jgi:2-C-methyl-D-erythritol 4-phosphate cytidylyltransferase